MQYYKTRSYFPGLGLLFGYTFIVHGTPRLVALQYAFRSLLTPRGRAEEREHTARNIKFFVMES